MTLKQRLSALVEVVITKLNSLKTNIDTRALKTTTITAGTGLLGGGNLSANRTFNVDFGTGVNQVARGNRLPEVIHYDLDSIGNSTGTSNIFTKVLSSNIMKHEFSLLECDFDFVCVSGNSSAKVTFGVYLGSVLLGVIYDVAFVTSTLTKMKVIIHTVDSDNIKGSIVINNYVQAVLIPFDEQSNLTVDNLLRVTASSSPDIANLIRRKTARIVHTPYVI